MTTRDVETAVTTLASLGKTADAVAKALISRGIKALPGCASSCVIAEWLVAEMSLTSYAEIEVDGKISGDGWSVAVWDIDNQISGKADLPAHLGELAERFDRGDWPELEATR